jgi:N-acetylglucosaminyl-diphospho-decaprenol L-rhamnosyltransferase
MGSEQVQGARGAPLLDVVIVSYNCKDLLRRCLSSLKRHPPTTGRLRVQVVDNASSDDTPAMICAEFQGVDLERLDQNVGFAAANNRALRRSEAPFVLLLNPDTELTDGALDHMLATMREHADVGMAGCRLVRPDGSFDHAAKRSFPTPLAALAHFSGVGRGRDDRARLAQYRAPHLGEHDVGDVDAVNGAFMLVRATALDQVGLLDEGYWLYMEDLDWCYRFREKGWRVLYDGRATVVHVKGGSAGSHRAPRQNVAFHRGMGRFYRKFEAGRQPLLAGPVYAGIGVKLGFSLVRSALARRRAP